jgi:hypothetical protein
MKCDNHTFNSNKESFDWDKNLMNNFSDKEFDNIIKSKITNKIKETRPDRVRSKSEFIGNGDILEWNEKSKIEIEKPKYGIRKRNPNLKCGEEFNNTGTRFNKAMMTSKDNIFYN